METAHYNYLSIEQKENYAILQLNRGKANALNQAMVDELSEFFNLVVEDKHIEGVLLTGQAHFFSGGVDLPEVYHYSSEGIRHFWGSFLQLATTLVAFPKPLVAAITGHSPAGGCILACGCDYRVMANNEQYQIGLNEMAVGIAPRESILTLYASLIGQRRAYQYLLEGKLLSSHQALEVGLVDELHPLEETVAVAEKKLQHYLQLPQKAFQQTKKSLKAPLVRALTVNFEQDLDLLHQQLMSEESRRIMGKVVAYLQKGK